MSCSEARNAANRRNAQLSTGPKTLEGKAISRRNSLKHGLTGEGIVLPDEDVEVVAGRFERLQVELAPSTELGSILVQRVALLSVRLERAARQEAKTVGQSMRLASEKYVDRRMLDVEKMMDWIAAEPATHARRLRMTPEGVDRLIGAWLDLDAELDHPSLIRWGYGQWQRLENLNGRRPEDFPLSRDGALCKAFWGEFEFVQPGEVEGLDANGRREWARARLRERIAAKVAEFRALRATFDMGAIDIDRDEAGQRAIFNTSKEAILARKYEAAAERGLYRALKELREVEAEAAARPEPVGSDGEERACEPLASSCAGPPGGAPAMPSTAGSAQVSAGSSGKAGPKSARSSRRPSSGGVEGPRAS